MVCVNIHVILFIVLIMWLNRAELREILSKRKHLNIEISVMWFLFFPQLVMTTCISGSFIHSVFIKHEVNLLFPLLEKW